jgi:pimeloyl-ACP methyl ester carboxylesterase
MSHDCLGKNGLVKMPKMVKVLSRGYANESSGASKVLIMVGRHDYVCPVALSERLHEGIPQSLLVIFEESGHLPWLEEPNTFFAELERFLIL